MWVSQKIDGYENPSLKIDGFGRTYWTHADEAPVIMIMIVEKLSHV